MDYVVILKDNFKFLGLTLLSFNNFITSDKHTSSKMVKHVAHKPTILW